VVGSRREREEEKQHLQQHLASAAAGREAYPAAHQEVETRQLDSLEAEN